MSWERGRADIERLLADGELERVTPSGEMASRLLAVQGLRPTTRGGHVALIDAVRAQFNDRGVEVFGRLGRLRRRRNATEYPDPDSPTVTSEEAERALETAFATVNAAKRLIESDRLDAFD